MMETQEPRNGSPLLRAIQMALPGCSRVMVKGPVGTVELRGPDLVAKESDRSVTIYHAGAETSEAMSHVHLRKRDYRRIVEVKPEGKTSYWAFCLDEGVDPSAADFKIYGVKPSGE